MDSYQPDETNPYAPPSAPLAHPSPAQQRTWGLSREGNVLVASQGAVFPDRCVKCNAPANGYKLKRNLAWHHPAYYLIIFVCNLLIYVIVALCVRSTAKFEVGVCPVHRAKRRNAIIVAWGGIALGVVLFIASINYELPVLLLASIIGGLVTLVIGMLGSRIVYPKRIEGGFAWLKGAGPEFLDSIEMDGQA